MSDTSALDARQAMEVQTYYRNIMGAKAMPGSLAAMCRAPGKASKNARLANDREVFPFFKLPAEVRNRVYHHIVDSYCKPTRVFFPTCVNANKQMRAELLPVYIAGIRWRFYIDDPNRHRRYTNKWVHTMLWFRLIGDNARFITRFVIIMPVFAGCGGVIRMNLAAMAQRYVNPGFWKCRQRQRNGRVQIMHAFIGMLFDDLKSLGKRGVMSGELFVMSFLTFCEKYRRVTCEDVKPGRIALAGLAHD